MRQSLACARMKLWEETAGADSLSMLLQQFGHQVHVVHTGADALQLARRVKPQIAVLDIGMPGITRYQVAEQIRAEAWGQDMTLIAVTGWGQEEDKRRAKVAGFDHHLTKPVDPVVLEALIGSAESMAPGKRRE